MNPKRKKTFKEKKNKRNKSDNYEQISFEAGFNREETKKIKAFMLSLKENSDFRDFLITKDDLKGFKHKNSSEYAYGYHHDSLMPSLSVSKISEFEICETGLTKKSNSGEYYACVVLKNIPFFGYRAWNITETNLNVYYSWVDQTNPNGCEIYFILTFDKNPQGLLDVSKEVPTNEKNYMVLNTENSLEFKNLEGFEKTVINNFVKSIGGLSGIYSNYTFKISDNPRFDDHTIKEFEKDFNNFADIKNTPPEKILSVILGYYFYIDSDSLHSAHTNKETVRVSNSLEERSKAFDMIKTVPFYKTFHRITGDEKIFVKISGIPNISLNLIKSFCSCYHDYIVDIVFYSIWFRNQREVDFQLLVVLDRKATRKINNKIELSDRSNKMI